MITPKFLQELISSPKTGKKICAKVYKGQKPETQKVTDMKMSDKGIEWLKDKEDKVSDKYGNHIIHTVDKWLDLYQVAMP